MRPCQALHKGLVVALALPLFCLLGSDAAARHEHHKAAEQKVPVSKAAVQGRLQEGLSALSAHDFPLAAQKLGEAYLETPSLEGLYALGQLALAEGKTLPAQDLMRRFLADPLLEATPDSAEYREAQRVVSLPRLTSAKLEIQGSRGTIIKIDGRPVGVLPLSAVILTSPGEHDVQLLVGDKELREKVRLRAGRYSELRYNLASRAIILNVLPGALIVFAAPGLTAEEQRRLSEALDGATQKERYSPLSAETESKAACKAGENCPLKQARSLQAEYIVTARAEKQGPDWTLGMELFDVEVGNRAATGNSSCPGCTADSAAAKLAALFSPLLKEAVDLPRGKVHIVSDPSGADVTIDGQLVGVTPYEGPAFIGVHKLGLTRKRFQDQGAQVEVKENQTAEARVALVDLPDPEPPPPCPLPPPCPACKPPPPPPPPPLMRVPRWRLLTGILGITAGMLMIGVGAPAIALDGRCADDPLVPGAVCQSQYQSLAAGAALFGVGGALAITGTVLLALPPKRIAVGKRP